MKKSIFLLLSICFFIVGCSKSSRKQAEMKDEINNYFKQCVIYPPSLKYYDEEYNVIDYTQIEDGVYSDTTIVYNTLYRVAYQWRFCEKTRPTWYNDTLSVYASSENEACEKAKIKEKNLCTEEWLARTTKNFKVIEIQKLKTLILPHYRFVVTWSAQNKMGGSHVTTDTIYILKSTYDKGYYAITDIDDITFFKVLETMKK